MYALLEDATFWTAVSFVLFVLLLWWKARGVIGAAVGGRIERIREQIKSAETLHDDAKKILSDLSEQEVASKKHCEDIFGAAEVEAEALIAQARARTDEVMERKLDNAKLRIRQEERRARQEIHAYVIDTAIAAAEKIIRDDSKQMTGKPLFEQGLEQLKKTSLQ